MHTGRSLRELDSGSLVDIGYRLMLKFEIVSEEEYEAIRKVDGKIADLVFEDETGMPAITQLIPPADEMVKRRG